MSDHDHDPAVPPEQEARLRRLLTQARHVEPVPDDLAARLDRVLEQLEAEEPDLRAGGDIVDLAARRRRRVRALLVAAAAVVVVGVGVGQVLPGGQDDANPAASEAAGGSADSSADSSLADPDDPLSYESGDTAASRKGPAPGAEGDVDSRSSVTRRARPPVRLSAEGFAKQAVQLRNRPGVTTSGEVVAGDSLSVAARFVCATADWGTGKLLPALYDAVPSVLVYRPVAGETQTVDLLRCGTGEVLRSTVLPVED